MNHKLETSGKESRINSFQDPKIASAIPIIDLIDAIKPGVINYELLQEGGNYEVLQSIIIKPFYDYCKGPENISRTLIAWFV